MSLGFEANDVRRMFPRLKIGPTVANVGSRPPIFHFGETQGKNCYPTNQPERIVAAKDVANEDLNPGFHNFLKSVGPMRF